MKVLKITATATTINELRVILLILTRRYRKYRAHIIYYRKVETFG